MKKSLALYVDKWYIIGSVYANDTIRPVRLPNGEDRIWLYFYEDVANDRILYSKDFQRNFRNAENHYYGDIFSLMGKSESSFILFRLKQPIREIFSAANIFLDLRNDVKEENTDITTYVSFSQDISYTARYRFLEELKKAKFHVVESVVRIEHLALEHAVRESKLVNDGHYIIISACNENLHFSIYQKNKDIFVRIYEENFIGKGMDVRKHTLVEFVVDSINKWEHILTNEERETELLRMAQFVDGWLLKLSNAPRNVPIQLTDITLSKDPYKPYSVQVRKDKMDRYTEKFIEDIFKQIEICIRDSKVHLDDIKGILFLGDTLTNKQFSEEIHKLLGNIAEVSYKEADIPSIIGAYNFIDCSQFTIERIGVEEITQVEIKRKELAREEEEKKKIAEEEAKIRKETENKIAEKIRRYKEVMNKGYEAEKEHDYDSMVHYFAIAIEINPEDKEAKLKHDDALHKKAEEGVRQSNYLKIIQEAKEAFHKEEWDVAKQKSEEALTFMPKSKEAFRIKEKSSEFIKNANILDKCLNRISVFVEQKAYRKAIKELNETKSLEVGIKLKEKIQQYENEIQNEINTRNEKIEILSNKLKSTLTEGEFEKAINLCKELLAIDIENTEKWSACMNEIKQKERIEDEKREQLQRLQQEIDSAQWDEDWGKLISLCHKFLKIHEDVSIREKLKKAEEKDMQQKSIIRFNESCIEIKNLIYSYKFREARVRLKELSSNKVYDEQQVRDLNALLFKVETDGITDFFDDTKKNESRISDQKSIQINNTDFDF